MRAAFCSMLVVVSGMATLAFAADDAKLKAIEKDSKQIAGTWRIAELVVEGNEVDVQQLKHATIVNADDGTWSFRLKDSEISRGTNVFDPTQEPKTVDFYPTDGEGRDNKYQGIYELGEKTRKLCFALTGSTRPVEFASPKDSNIVLMVLERVEAE